MGAGQRRRSWGELGTRLRTANVDRYFIIVEKLAALVEAEEDLAAIREARPDLGLVLLTGGQCRPKPGHEH